MKNTKNLIFFILLSVVSIGQNEAHATLLENSIQDLCESFLKQYEIPHKTKFSKIFSDLIKLSFTPAYYGEPEFYEGMESAEKADSAAGEGNAIFAPGPIHYDGNIEKGKREIKILEALEKQQRSYIEKFQKLKKISLSKGSKACEMEAQKMSFSIEAFHSIHLEIEKKSDIDQLRQFFLIQSEFNKLKKHLKLGWTLFYYTEIGDLLSKIRNDKIKNLMIIGHGTKEGMLLDSTKAVYPFSFFKSLPEHSIDSFSLFSCHSHQISNAFQLEHSKSLSRYYLSKESSFLGDEGVSPLSAWGVFLKKVDEREYRFQNPNPNLNLNLKILAGSPEDLKNRCYLRLTGVLQKNGSTGIFIGEHLLTTVIKLSQDENEIPFPCDWLNKDYSPVVLRELLVRGESSLDVLQSFKLTVTIDSKETQFNVKWFKSLKNNSEIVGMRALKN